MRRIIFGCLLFLVYAEVIAQTMDTHTTTIFWDTSISMQDRDLEKDFGILEKVFARTPDQEVKVVFFNITAEIVDYSIRDGNWDLLKKDLSKVTYDGANVYTILEDLAGTANNYLFTDGRRVYENDAPVLPKNTYLINSSTNRDEEFLKRTALLNRNRLMDFAAILPENIGSLKKKETNAAPLISGKVYIDNSPASEVTIAVKGMQGGVLSGSDGSFSINAQPNDSLLITSRINNTYKIVPVNEKDVMAVFMESNVFTLNEVVLIEKKQAEEGVLNTPYGKENEEKIGYAVQTLEDKDITAIQTDVSQSVINKFSNVTLGNKEDLSKATMRSNTSILGNNYSLVVIDGVPQRQSDSSSGASSSNQTGFDYINPDNIASITVLKGYAATNKYGSLGANGVILITTKSAAASKTSGEPVDLARLTDNIYSEDTSKPATNQSSIRITLEEARSTEEAYLKYLLLRPASKTDINFFFEAYDFFKETDKERAAVIISSVLELFPKDVKTLRAVSFALAGADNHDEVIRINEEIIAIDNNNAQAYLDRALAKQAKDEHQSSLNELLALESGIKYPLLNTSGISKTLNREVRNLIFRHKNTMNVASVPTKFMNNVKYNVRLLFEWNDPEAEFNLQFVNPQKRYFNWEHNREGSAERMKDEIINGYSSEEFEFYGEGVQGTWILNATYLGNLETTNTTPFVLKCTLYQNFGYSNQTKEEIVVNFTNPEEVKQLKSLIVN
ncbi:MAG: TonB-dependent receptor plug domain-containing protein [Eudoraea sp.]|nr:TonB-dependent receptor plug domain-containing protein [Eudoraea sp.]